MKLFFSFLALTLLLGLGVYFFNNQSVVLSFFRFDRKTAPLPESQNPVPVISVDTSIPPEIPVVSKSFTYTPLVLTTDTPGKEIVDAIGGYEHLSAVLSLNRIDDKHLQKGMEIVIPSRFDDTSLFTGFPKSISELSAIPKILLISQQTQEFGAYEYGQLVRFGGISTGKKSTPTKNGLYHTNWKAEESISTVNDEWLLKWNFNIDNLGGIGIHQYDLPGYPASHSCIRLSETDAMWFYEWADQWKLSRDERTVLQKGTPVLLFGGYDFDGIAPWKTLPENPDALKINLSEIDFALLQ